MNDFVITNVAINDRLAGLIEREGNVSRASINSIVGFDEGSVYHDTTLRLSGILVITGPEPRIHVFTRAGLTYKHRGYFDHLGGYGGLWATSELSEYLVKQHPKLTAAFNDCANTVMAAVIDASTKSN